MDNNLQNATSVRADFEATAKDIAVNFGLTLDFSTWDGRTYTDRSTTLLYTMYRQGRLDERGETGENMAAPRWGIRVGEPEILGERCADGGKCHHECDTSCFRKEACVPLTGSGLNDDWSVPTHAQ